MELEECLFRVIDVIYLRNMVHNGKVQKAMKKNWIRDKERSFSYFLSVTGSSMISAHDICSKYTILLGMKYHPLYAPNIKKKKKDLTLKKKEAFLFVCLKALKVCASFFRELCDFAP